MPDIGGRTADGASAKKSWRNMLLRFIYDLTSPYRNYRVWALEDGRFVPVVWFQGRWMSFYRTADRASWLAPFMLYTDDPAAAAVFETADQAQDFIDRVLALYTAQRDRARERAARVKKGWQ